MICKHAFEKKYLNWIRYLTHINMSNTLWSTCTKKLEMMHGQFEWFTCFNSQKIKKLDQVVHLITSFQQVQSPTCPRLCGTSELVMGLWHTVIRSWHSVRHIVIRSWHNVRATTEVEFFSTWTSQPTPARHMCSTHICLSVGHGREGGWPWLILQWCIRSIKCWAPGVLNLFWSDNLELTAQLPTQNWIKI